LINDAHSKGFLFRLYSDAGTKIYEGRSGSLCYEKYDAQMYAKWGIDYLKYDNCYNENKLANEKYPTMRDALKNYTTTRPIFYSMCNWGEEDIENNRRYK
jgi:alpha-galactosidase